MNSIRNRVRDLFRRPPLFQPFGDLSRQLGAGQLERLGPACPLTGALMRLPSAVFASAAVASHLPRHRGRGLAEPGRDRCERFAATKAKTDLLPVGHGEPTLPRLPVVRAHGVFRFTADNGSDDFMGTPDLAADLPQRHALRTQATGQLALLHRQMGGHQHLPRSIDVFSSNPSSSLR